MKIYLVIIILLAGFLRIYRLNDLMPFIGDFAWFYISARDMLLTGQIPLVGIVSSHTWVHQGPLWTYFLAIPLLLSNFQPLSGAYFTAILGTITVLLIYLIGTQMFSRFVGFVAAFFYATSPLAIIHSRMPYHTSLIPLVTLLFFFFLYKWIKGDVRFLSLVFFTLGILYNLELATLVFWILIILLFAYGIAKRERWFTKALKPKIILLSFFLFLVPMLPMIIYDFREHTSFYQITAFFRLIKIYLFSGSYAFSFEGMRDIFSSLFLYNQRLVFLGNGSLALLLTAASFFYVVLAVVLSSRGSFSDRDDLKRLLRFARNDSISLFLLLLWIALPLSGIILSKTASEAYIPMLFPPIILTISLLFNHIYKRYAFITIGTIIIVAITNMYLLIAKNFLMGVAGEYGLPFSNRLTKAQEIVKKSKGKKYNLVGKGKGSAYKSFTMNYEYLTWWLGHPPSKSDEKLKFIIEEK